MNRNGSSFLVERGSDGQRIVLCPLSSLITFLISAVSMLRTKLHETARIHWRNSGCLPVLLVFGHCSRYCSRGAVYPRLVLVAIRMWIQVGGLVYVLFGVGMRTLPCITWHNPRSRPQWKGGMNTEERASGLLSWGWRHFLELTLENYRNYMAREIPAKISPLLPRIAGMKSRQVREQQHLESAYTRSTCIPGRPLFGNGIRRQSSQFMAHTWRRNGIEKKNEIRIQCERGHCLS